MKRRELLRHSMKYETRVLPFPRFHGDSLEIVNLPFGPGPRSGRTWPDPAP